MDVCMSFRKFTVTKRRDSTDLRGSVYEEARTGTKHTLKKKEVKFYIQTEEEREKGRNAM